MSRTLAGRSDQPGAVARTSASGSGRTSSTGSGRPSMRDAGGRAKTGSKTSTGGKAVQGGWAAYKKTSNRRQGGGIVRLEIEEGKPTFIRFAEAEPFAVYYQHWIDKRPYTCIADADADDPVICPLCDVGDQAKCVVAYNVIDLGDASLKIWNMSPDPTRRVQEHYDELAEAEKTLDDPTLYFKVSKAKKSNGITEYTVVRVKARDLDEDYNLEALTPEEIADAIGEDGSKLYTDKLIKLPTVAELREIASDLED